MIDPSQARYRSAVAMHRLATALGVQLLPTAEDCECLERLATQAERLFPHSERKSIPPVLAANQESRATASKHFKEARRLLKGIR